MASQVIIIGGGVTGLALAYELAQTSHFDVTLLECSSRLGGLAGGVPFEGLELDLGSHRIHPLAQAEALDLLKRLLGDSLRLMPRQGLIRFRNRWVEYPPSIVQMAQAYGPLPLARAGASWIKARVRMRRDRSFTTFEDVLKHRLGSRLFNDFYQSYSDKLWGRKASEMSAVAAEQRSQRISAKRLVRDLISFVSPKTNCHRFLYPARGFGAIVDALEQQLTCLGVKILKNAEVKSLQCDESGKISSVHWKSKSGVHETPVDWVVSTAPVHFNLSLLGQPEPKLHYRGLRVLYCITSAQPKLPGETLYLPGSETRFGRISFPLRYGGHSTEPGKFPIVLEAPCSPGDETWEMDDFSLLEIAKRDLVELGFFDHLEISEFRSVKVPKVYPIYEVGWEDSWRKALEAQRAFPNFLPIGRSALFLHCNIDHCIAMGVQLSRLMSSAEDPHGRWSEQVGSFQDFTPHE